MHSSSGLSETQLGQDVLTGVTGHQGDELLRQRRPGRLLQHGDGIDIHHARGLGELHRRHLVFSAERVGHIDQRGVGLPGGDLVEYVSHAEFLTDRVQLHPSAVLDALGRRSARNWLLADDHVEPGFVEVREGSDLLGIARRGDDDQGVGGEIRRIAVHQSGLDDRVHLGGVRGCEDVGSRPLGQLRSQLGGAHEVKIDVTAGVVGLELLTDLGE